MVLLFCFELNWARYDHFHFQWLLAFHIQISKMKKWPYLTQFSSKCKNKPTLFSPTFKIEEKKVVLLFCFELNWARYGHFHFQWFLAFQIQISKMKKWPYLAQFSSKQKNKTTFFSSTLKVGEEKVVLFFHFELKWARYGWLFVFLKNSNRSYFWKLGPAQDHPKMFTKLKIFFSCASMTTSITRKSHGKIDFLIFPK